MLSIYVAHERCQVWARLVPELAPLRKQDRISLIVAQLRTCYFYCHLTVTITHTGKYDRMYCTFVRAYVHLHTYVNTHTLLILHSLEWKANGKFVTNL